MKLTARLGDRVLLAIAFALFLSLGIVSSFLFSQHRSTLRWLVNDPLAVLMSPAAVGSTIWQLVVLACAGAGMVMALWSITSLVVAEVLFLTRRWGASFDLDSFVTSRTLSPLTRHLILRRCATVVAISSLITPPAIGAEIPRDLGWPTPGTHASTPAPHHSPTVDAPQSSRQDSLYTVRSGDCLWSIAARVLQTDDEARIDSYWRQIYRLNKEVIGSSPNHIFPGIDLQLPEGDHQ
ncbi:MAG: LysM domain-containing protein [Actinomycetaceae bacterium]|nr:LysM domain-containing protein [Actinomycetaceae bacterium]